MKNNQKIIRFLIDHKDEYFSINNISKSLKLNYRIAFEEVKKLEKEGIIAIKRLGNSNQCVFNYHFNEKVLEAENRKREEFLKNKDFKVIYGRLMEIRNPFFVCLVFGSYAKGTQTKRSDLDLCLITDNKEVKQKAEQTIRLIPFEIHFLCFTTKEFISMLITTEFNVGKEIMKDNIILKGAEEFYEMVNYVRR